MPRLSGGMLGLVVTLIGLGSTQGRKNPGYTPRCWASGVLRRLPPRVQEAAEPDCSHGEMICNEMATRDKSCSVHCKLDDDAWEDFDASCTRYKGAAYKIVGSVSGILNTGTWTYQQMKVACIDLHCDSTVDHRVFLEDRKQAEDWCDRERYACSFLFVYRLQDITWVGYSKFVGGLLCFFVMTYFLFGGDWLRIAKGYGMFSAMYLMTGFHFSMALFIFSGSCIWWGWEWWDYKGLTKKATQKIKSEVLKKNSETSKKNSETSKKKCETSKKKRKSKKKSKTSKKTS